MSVVDVRTDHLATAERYAADRATWPVVPRFDPTARWYCRLAEQPDHEVWLLTWLPGQGTELHDHGGSAGAFVVVEGTLVEETVAPGGPTPDLAVHRHPTGAGRRFGAQHVHRIVNTSDRPAISVHVYGPALTSMTRYALGPGGLDVLGIERAGAQW